MQTSFLPIRIEAEFDSHYDGADLKRIAKGDDGNTYALKRIADHPLMPLCEWVGHHLCRACGIATPDFAVMESKDTPADPPAFGSRIATYSQIEASPSSYQTTVFFASHTAALARVYALDAFLANPDRHGRNFFVRPDPAGGPPTLVAFDFARMVTHWPAFWQH